MRLIKKYPNRRLYDTEISSYITLGDVRQLVLDSERFKVQDAKTKEDITRSILLQIIIEQEDDGEPILSIETLERIVRFYGDDLQSMVSSYLDKSLKLFVDQQEGFRDQLRQAIGGDALRVMRETADRNLGIWKEMQETFLSAANGPQGATKRSRTGNSKG